MIKYTCTNNDCGANFRRITNMPAKSTVPCAQCGGTMTVEED